ncbi:MAG: SusC/RagA family TonB-linked outer membrane protein [Bacteroidales bacterium]
MKIYNANLITHWKTCLYLIILLFSPTIFSQTYKSANSGKEITVAGTVVDEKGEALTGASIYVDGSNKGTITDIRGEFKINAKSNATLVITYIGYNKLTLPVNGKTNVKITLVEITKKLDEVVVVGYGQQRRKDVTGSLGTVEIADMNKAPVPNFTDALSGRVAGVVVTSPDGQPGSTPNIVIRGNGSITQDNSPLWVVDGFPIENYNNNAVNPNDIESIDILKDASATAIYGARGANGVIIVTTKKGKLGDPTISFNSSISQLQLTRKMQIMDGQQYLQYQIDRDLLSKNYAKDQSTGTIINPVITNTEYLYLRNTANGLSDYYGRGVDLQDHMFRPAFAQNHDLSISGGSTTTKYYISGNYMNQEGIMINTGYKRIQGKVVLDQNIGKYVRIGINVNYSHMNQSGNSPLAINFPGYWTSSQSPFTMLWGARPVTPIRADGTSFDIINDFQDAAFVSGNGASSFLINPVVNQRETLNERLTDNLTANSYVNIAFTPALSLRSTLGYVSNSAENDIYYNTRTAQGSPLTANGSVKGNNGSIYNLISSTWSNENILTYNKSINKRHNINFTGLISEQSGAVRSNGYSAVLCPNPNLGISGLDEGTPSFAPSTSTNYTLASFMGRINYNYNSRYYITISNRSDGSSKFAKENHWANFSSGALKWSFANERFMKKFKKTISSGSVRYSLGQTGNNRVNDFASYSMLTIGAMVAPYTFNNTIPTQGIPTVAGNPNLKWETTTQSNIGVDLGLFKDRILIVADFYVKTTDNLLLNKSASPTSGYSTVMANIGSLENRGVEFSLNTVNFRSRNFEWTSTFNISMNRNKVLSLGEGQVSMLNTTGFDTNFASSPSYISKVGQPVGQIYGLVWEGNYQNSDFNYLTSVNPSAANAGLNGSHWLLKDDVPTNGSARASIQPGDIKFKDLNGDGIIDSNDLTVIGRGTPIHTGGFGNNFRLYNFDLNVFFQWSYGNNIQNANRIIFEGNTINQSYLNQFASYSDRWTPTNTESANFRLFGQGPNGYYSSRTVEDGSFLRLKTLSLGYNLPQKLIKKLSIKEFRVSVSGQNLLTFTNYTGFDPEVSSYNSVLTPGFDWSGYPKGRTFAAGVNLKF